MQEPAVDFILACVTKWKYYCRIFNTFFVNTVEIKNSQKFFAIFWPIRHCGLLISNSYGYVQDEAVDRIYACVTTWVYYCRIFNIFFC